MNGMNKEQAGEYANGWEWIEETYITDPYAFNELKAHLKKWNGHDYFELAVSDFIRNKPNRNKVEYNDSNIHEEVFHFTGVYDEDSMKMYLIVMLFVHAMVAVLVYSLLREFNLLYHILSYIIFVVVIPYLFYGVNMAMDKLVKKIVNLIFKE